MLVKSKLLNKKQIASSVLAQNWNAQSMHGLEPLALESAQQIFIWIHHYYNLYSAEPYIQFYHILRLNHENWNCCF